jgi:hypothetical protein
MRSAVAVVLLLVAAAGTARADKVAAYRSRSFQDPAGRYRVEMTGRADGGATFLFAHFPEAAGRAPAQPHVLGTGELPDAPDRVLVSPTGAGFAAMDEHGRSGQGVSFAWVGANGAVRHRKRLAELFEPAQVSSFPQTVSGTRWFRGAWLDERDGNVLVVGTGGALRVVSVATGAVRAGTDADLLAGLSVPDPAGRALAVDLAVEAKSVRLDVGILALLADPAGDAETILHAARALGARGDARGRGLTLSVARGPRALQERAVQGLVEALGDGSAPAAARVGAAQALGRLGPRSAWPGLVAAVAAPEAAVAGASLDAAMAAGKEAVAPDLAAALDAGTPTQDGRIAAWFRFVKSPSSIGPLVKALVRHAKDAAVRDEVLAALRHQTGQDLGSDPAAWVAWWEAQPR